MIMTALLVFALLISTGLADLLHPIGWPPTPVKAKQPDNRCGHQICPSGYGDNGDGLGYTDDGHAVKGRICNEAVAPVYARGDGYVWKIEDWNLSLKGAMKRCNKDESILGCEVWGAMAYRKCQWGYSSWHCCTCKPKCPGVFLKVNNVDHVCVLPCTPE